MNKLLVMALAATMAFASCSKEGGDGKDKTGSGENTYAGVSITLPATMGTRADDPNAGIDGEKAVTTVGVYIVDVNSQRLDYKILTVASDFEAETTNGSNQKVYKAKTAVPTVTGTKKVYVVANPTTAITNKLDVSGAYVMGETAFGVAESNFLNAASSSVLTNMVMSGAYTATGGELDMTAAQTATEATDAPIDITISRNLSKAVVQRAQVCNVVGGTTTLTWTLINKANDAYFLPQSAGTIYRTVPSAAETDDSHAYWSNFSGRTGTNYINVLDYGSGDAKTATYEQSKYMFENFPAALHEGNTTGARIKGVFKPTVIYGSIMGGVPQDVGSSFIGGTDFYRSKIDGTYWTSNGRNEAVTNTYNGHTASSDFTYYAGGVGYYTIWVNDGSVKGVKRNSYYLMQINEVKGPGSPTEPTDPLPPIEDDTNLGVNITILNWDYNKSVQGIQ